ncbi:MAG: hypothetical protein ABI540_06210 [Spartobacteria bacterium]
MADSDEEEKKTTKAVTDEPQEEFIEPKARPSEDEHDAARKPTQPPM